MSRNTFAVLFYDDPEDTTHECDKCDKQGVCVHVKTLSGDVFVLCKECWEEINFGFYTNPIINNHEIIKSQIDILQKHIEHPTKPGYKRHDIVDKIIELTELLNQ